MTASFFEAPILNSPYEPPTRHHALDKDGQPLDQPPVDGRRRSELITPVPKPRKLLKRAGAAQASLGFSDPAGLSTSEQEYNPTPIINEIRQHIETWRTIPNPADWGVTPATAQLLKHWRHHNFQGVRPFFCQTEAVETVIWMTEVARREKRYRHLWTHVEGANKDANPELMRLALKMATGSGKTTVMAMLIAWQTVNAVRSPTSTLFTRGFLLIAPGITIRDRLRVLLPQDADSYYRTRELLPPDMLPDIDRAKIVIANYHAFKRRETMDVSKVGRALLQGRGEPVVTIETEGQMLQRACGELLAMKNVVVINDEAHHCYREKPGSDDEAEFKGEDKDEAKKNNEAARLWISGIEALNRKVGVRAVYDLSATPFFLQGSGYAEGTLFPWTVSDFSLMDAIECGIVKLPRVPVADNLPEAEVPIYRDLWKHIGKEMPKKGAAKSGKLDPLSIPAELQTALYALYGHYVKTYEEWRKVGIAVPPVFIVVCNNTSTSKLVYEWISGFERESEDGEKVREHSGHLELFQNFDQYGNRLARPNTLLIDSEQLESGDALEPAFREMAGPEIEQFRRERAQRSGAAGADDISDSELLREVMNTVGKPGRLGEQVRCVVSVSMLTEGWDTNTVTHILGVRAFGTQLLCEQVVGRALRRQSYDLNEEGLFDVEYADILGIPFDFATKPVVTPPKPPKPVTRVHAIKARERFTISFPRVTGYRKDLPQERITADFKADSKLLLTPELVGPCTTLLEGIVGEGIEITPKVLEGIRQSTISFEIAKVLLYTRFREPGEQPPLHLFGQIKSITRRWIEEGYLECTGGTVPAMVTYREIAEKAAELIYLACQRGHSGTSRMKAILEPYNPLGRTTHVSFNTSKSDLYATSGDRCHVNYVVCDSSWEAELARVVEAHPRVIAYVKNQGLQFEVPYRDGAIPKKYLPDFIVQVDDGPITGARTQGSDDPLNIVIETKGYRGIDAQLKAETMASLWVPGVNNLGTHGRWAFAEFKDVFEIENAFAKLVDEAVGMVAA
ncbi:MAG TPA: DEAD/DEAH box helicase family protein [Hyphomicrobiaceae bacterium]|nr:DEAD/DEAH box helicase family protein [Hyphomicrobiaceae bacterium]